MKDVETIRPADIIIAAMLPRADPRDRLIGAESIDALPRKARVGTSSPRRAAQLLNLRPDLKIKTLRGNVATRMEAVQSGKVDATMLAAAGLDRLGHDTIGATLEIDALLPAPQQGAVGIEVMAKRVDLLDIFQPINDQITRSCIQAERAFLHALGADCHSPVAAHAYVENGRASFQAQLFTNDGGETISDAVIMADDAIGAAASALARTMLANASEAIRALFAV